MLLQIGGCEELLRERVGCEIDNGTAYTTFDHDAKSVRYFTQPNHQLFSNITYKNSIQFIQKAIQSFSSCHQEFFIESYDNSASSSHFESVIGLKVSGADQDCVKCNEILINQRTVTSGLAWIEKKKYFPLKGMKFADNDDSHEYLRINLYKLRCK